MSPPFHQHQHQAQNPVFHPGSSTDFSGNPVLLVGNLSEKCTPDILYALFSCYGDIQRIKILYNKRENSLIQFGSSQHASTGPFFFDFSSDSSKKYLMFFFFSSQPQL